MYIQYAYFRLVYSGSSKYIKNTFLCSVFDVFMEYHSLTKAVTVFNSGTDSLSCMEEETAHSGSKGGLISNILLTNEGTKYF